MKHLLPAALLILLPSAFCLAQRQTPWSADDTWAFLPGDDPHTDDALFSLRPLLDKTAGEKGWIRHDANGGFIRGDGSPIRFWAANAGTHDGNAAALETAAKNYAKRGINLVRLSLMPIAPDNPAVNLEKLGHLQLAISIYQKHGIYCLLTNYWSSDGRLFFDPVRQAAYKNWWREILTLPNPHDPGKKPLRDNPALAILQIQNEDSLFFWTFMLIHNDDRRAEYDTLNAEFKAWLARNNLPDSSLRFMFWNINEADPAHARIPDEDLRLTMRWAAEKMRAFNAETAGFLRGEIGCPALVNAGNWQTADQVRLLDLERWAYDANDVIAANTYVDMSGHHNPTGRGGWLVEAGDVFQNASCLRGGNWRSLPTNVKQVKGKPFIVTETGWVSPNLYQAEAPFLLSAYMSLNGVDACLWYIVGSPGFDVSSWPWQSGLYKWGNHASPQVMGGWPATAWMFHKGYVRRGEIAVDEKRAFAGDLWELKVPVIAEDSRFDPNRPGTTRAQSNIVGGAPYAAFLIGPVEIEYGRDPAGTAVNLHGNTAEDLARGLIKSSTGEVIMDTPRGVCVIDAPCAQGVAGFLGEAGTVTTGALAIDMSNEYGAVLAVSLDDAPLASSKKILLQITTQSRPDGWADEPAKHEDKDVLKILNTGGGNHNAGQNHWRVKNTSGLVAVKNAGLTKATQCDANFYAKEDIPVKRRGDTLEIKLPPDALYIVLE